MGQVVGQDVQFPERHHQPAAGQAQGLRARVPGPQPFLVDVARIPAEFLQQGALRVQVLRAEPRGVQVAEHAVLPGHIPLDHAPAGASCRAGRPEPAGRPEIEGAAGEQGVRGRVRLELLGRSGRGHGEPGWGHGQAARGQARGPVRGDGPTTLLDHVRHLVRQQP